MKLSFRQGIVRHQTDNLGSPTFLNVSGGYVSLVASPDPTIVAFVHGDKDYLYTERLTVPNAWGPVSTGADVWLYWQLNPATGTREFGITSLEPIEVGVMPTNPQAGQMWFNTITNTWFEWNGISWVEVIRVFACRLENGQTPRSMSINTPAFTGTQVGLTQGKRVGALAYDGMGNPIRTGDKKFFTTEDNFVTGVPSGAQVRVNNIVIPGIAQQPIAAYSVVEYFDFNRLIPASPYSQGTKVYGFVEEDAPTGAMVNFVVEGMITNEDWDWVAAGNDVNDPVYNDGTGLIVTTPAIPDQLPVGVITGRHEILFAPRLFPQVESNVTISQAFTELTDTPNSYAGLAGRFVRINPTETGVEFALVDQDVNWGEITGAIASQSDLQMELDAKADAAHTHVEADITDLDKYTVAQVDSALLLKSDVGHTHVEADITDLNKYTQAEVDSLLSGKSNVGHTHLESDITDLDKYSQAQVDAALATKAETGANVGSGAQIAEVFRDKTGSTLNFKRLVAGTNVTLADSGNEITITATDSTLGDAPSDGTPYSRQDGGWVAAGAGGIADAPSDGNQYARQDGAWTQVSAGGGSSDPLEIPTFQNVTLYSRFGNDIPNGTWHYEVVTDPFTIFDYGHRSSRDDDTGGGYNRNPRFGLYKNGTRIGYLRLPDDDADNDFTIDMDAPVTDFEQGDRFEVRSQDTSDIDDYNNVALNIRRVMTPRAPTGTLTIAWDQATYNESTEAFTLTVTGDYSHIELAPIETSDDSGYTWNPADAGQSLGGFNLGIIEFSVASGGKTMQVHAENYFATREVTGDIYADLNEAMYVRIRATVFGPAGYATATMVKQFYSNMG